MRPYDEDMLPSYEEIHASVPFVDIDPGRLLPTQPMLDIGRLLAIWFSGEAEGPDECVHVVEYDGRLFVHNGHHRWMLALLGERKLRARIVRTEANGR